MKNAQENVCVLMFDEMPIDLYIHYQQGIDSIIGFEDYGDEIRVLLADHASVFLLRVIFVNFCYYHNFHHCTFQGFTDNANKLFYCKKWTSKIIYVETSDKEYYS